MTAVVQLECEYPGVNRPPHRKVPLPEPPSQFGNIVSGAYTPGTQRVIGLWGGGRTWGRTWNVGWSRRKESESNGGW